LELKVGSARAHSLGAAAYTPPVKLVPGILVLALALAGAWFGDDGPRGLAAPGDAPRAEHPAERGPCVEALTLAGLVLDERAQDADFERAFTALPRDERALARHRIRKLFAAGQEDAQAIRALVPSASEIDLLARELRWLSANLAAEPGDPLAVLRVAPAYGAGDPDSIARHYAGACDEELAREHDALLRALAVENDRGLDERIALGRYRVRQQSGEY